MLFWLGIETLLTPLVMLLFTLAFASQQTPTAAGQAGAATGGFVLIVISFLVGIPLGIVLYLISRRLDVEGGEAVETG